LGLPLLFAFLDLPLAVEDEVLGFSYAVEAGMFAA
jgi:hypothetical protein